MARALAGVRMWGTKEEAVPTDTVTEEEVLDEGEELLVEEVSIDGLCGVY